MAIKLLSSGVFFFISLLLWFGEGKQEKVELIASAGCIILACAYFFARSTFKRPWQMSLLLTKLFSLLIVYIALRVPWSADIGYAWSDLAWWCMAYLIFSFASHVSKTFSLQLLVYNVTFLSNFAVASYVLINIFPQLQRLLPLSNIFTSPYGHTHIVDLLLPLLPTFLTTLASSWSLLLPLLLTTIPIILSRARLAQILVAIVLILRLIQTKTNKFRHQLIILLSLLGVLSIVGYMLITNFDSFSRIFAPQGEKEHSINISRFRYWRHALLAFRESPIFGQGPGSFYLSSLKFQEFNRGWSASAHNDQLEIISELGIIGLIAIIIPVYLLFLSPKKRAYPDWYRPVKQGAMLIFLYSLFDYPLNFLPVWLLWWFFLGLLAGHEAPSNPSNNTIIFGKGTQIICFALLCLFIITSKIIPSLNVIHEIHFFQIAHNSNTAPSDANIQRTILFHSRHPWVLQSIAANPNLPIATRLSIYEKILDLYTKNEVIQKEYLELLTQTQTESEFADTKQRPAQISESISKTFYNLGFFFLKLSNYDLTLKSWQMAKDLSPDWDLFHLELASFYKYIQKDEGEARKVLIDCQKYYYPKLSCQQQLENFDQLKLPGTYLKEIKTIPRVVN